jgi:hypothetical protein
VGGGTWTRRWILQSRHSSCNVRWYSPLTTLACYVMVSKTEQYRRLDRRVDIYTSRADVLYPSPFVPFCLFRLLSLYVALYGLNDFFVFGWFCFCFSLLSNLPVMGWPDSLLSTSDHTENRVSQKVSPFSRALYFLIPLY